MARKVTVSRGQAKQKLEYLADSAAAEFARRADAALGRSEAEATETEKGEVRGRLPGPIARSKHFGNIS